MRIPFLQNIPTKPSFYPVLETAVCVQCPLINIPKNAKSQIHHIA
jgi:hypothetical protein